MINNKEIILPLLEFPNDDIFYFVQILQRKKDNKGKVLGGNNNNSRLIKAYFINYPEKLEKQWEEMTMLADLFNARVSINLNPRNYKKAAFHTLQKIANQMSNGDFQSIHKAYTSVCGDYHAEIDKRWLVDLDKDQLDLKDEILEFIKYEHSLLSKNEKASRYKIIGEIPSKTGLHLITNPFNLKNWKWSDVEIHRNNPTSLYIP